MDTTVSALKKLYVALGGSADDVAEITLIPEMINAIAEQVTANANAEQADTPKT